MVDHGHFEKETLVQVLVSSWLFIVRFSDAAMLDYVPVQQQSNLVKYDSFLPSGGYVFKRDSENSGHVKNRGPKPSFLHVS